MMRAHAIFIILNRNNAMPDPHLCIFKIISEDTYYSIFHKLLCNDSLFWNLKMGPLIFIGNTSNLLNHM